MQPHYGVARPTPRRPRGRPVQQLVNRCRELGFDDDRLRLNLRVGVTEALANAMLYGNGRDPAKRVRVEANVSPDEVTVRVTDEGRGFDPQAVCDPTLPGNRSRPCGRGIFLIRSLMDHVEFNERGNSITMVLLAGSRTNRGRASR